MKESTRKDWEGFWKEFNSLHYPGKRGYWPQTAAVWFWILATPAAFCLLVSVLEPGALVLAAIFGVPAVIVGLRWLLVSRHLPDDSPGAPVPEEPGPS